MLLAASAPMWLLVLLLGRATGVERAAGLLLELSTAATAAEAASMVALVALLLLLLWMRLPGLRG